jgi:type I restriction enzyme S subunit
VNDCGDYKVSQLEKDGVLAINDGYRAKNNELSPLGVPFARAGNIDNGFHFEDADHFPVANLHKVGSKFSNPGDVLFTSKGTVGRFAFVKHDTPMFVYSPQLCFWRSLNHDLIDPRYLYYWMLGPEFSEQCDGVKSQTDMADYVSLRDQREMKIALPKIQLQRAIARILGTLDDKIELNRRMNQTLEALARAIFKSWFVDFDPVTAKAAGRQPIGMNTETAALFPSSFEESALGPSPKGWSIGTVRSMCSRIENGGTPRRDAPENWHPATIPWLTSAEVRQGIVTETESFISQQGFDNSSTKMWPAMSTVVALYGATAGQVCLTASNLCSNQACCGLVPLPNAELLLYLRVSSAVEELEQSTRGSAQQNLSQDIVSSLQMVVPAESVVCALNERVRPLILRMIDNLKQSRTLAALRDALLPRLLSGELRVREAEKVLETV